MFKIEANVPLQAHNTFGIIAKALQLASIQSTSDISSLLADPLLVGAPKFVLGGGSNLVLTGDVKPLVLKVEIMGKRLVTNVWWPRPPSTLLWKQALASRGTTSWHGR
jgi:UDP-N-acetylmuramate dehydrogenase